MIGRAQRRRDSVEATTKAFDQHRSFVAERLTLTGELTELTDEQAAALWSALIANAVEVLTDLGFVFEPYPGLADLTADDSELSADGFAVDEMARYAAQARKLTMDLRWALDQVEKQHSTADARKDPRVDGLLTWGLFKATTLLLQSQEFAKETQRYASQFATMMCAAIGRFSLHAETVAPAPKHQREVPVSMLQIVEAPGALGSAIRRMTAQGAPAVVYDPLFDQMTFERAAYVACYPAIIFGTVALLAGVQGYTDTLFHEYGHAATDKALRRGDGEMSAAVLTGDGGFQPDGEVVTHIAVDQHGNEIGRFRTFVSDGWFFAELTNYGPDPDDDTEILKTRMLIPITPASAGATFDDAMVARRLNKLTQIAQGYATGANDPTLMADLMAQRNRHHELMDAGATSRTGEVSSSNLKAVPPNLG